MLVSPRNIFALGEAGDLPRPIAAVHRAFRTPHVSIIVYAALAWILSITGAFKYLLAIFVIARMLVVWVDRGSPDRAAPPGGTRPVPRARRVVISVLALAACVALIATQTWQSVRDVVIVVVIGFAIRGAVRWRESRSTVRPGG